MNADIYLFGMVLGTHSFLLKDGFLRPDEYSEISEHYFLSGSFILTCKNTGIRLMT